MVFYVDHIGPDMGGKDYTPEDAEEMIDIS